MNSSLKGEETFKKLKSAVKDRKVKLRIVMNKPSPSNPDNDTTELAQAGLYAYMYVSVYLDMRPLVWFSELW